MSSKPHLEFAPAEPTLGRSWLTPGGVGGQVPKWPAERPRSGSGSRTRPRVVFVITSMVGGGAERAVARIVKGISSFGFDVSLLVNHFQGPNAAVLPPSIPVVEMNVRRLRFALPALVRRLQEMAPDVVVSHLWEVNALVIAAKIISRAPFKLIVCEHSSISRRASVSSIMVRRVLYPYADAVVAVSRALAEEIVRLLRICAEKVHTVYNPVLESGFYARVAELARKVSQRDRNVKIILGVGRLSRPKRFDVFLKVVARVRDVLPVRAIILGDGELRSELERLRSRLGLDEIVDMPGYVADPLEYMMESDVLLQTSDYEGLPNVLVEAVAAGLPIVATESSGGISEILHGEPGSFVVPRGNLSVLCDQVISVLKNPRDRRIPDEHSRVYRLFSEQAAAQRWSNLIQGVLEEH